MENEVKILRNAAAYVDPAATDAPMARRPLRRLVEGAAIAAELAGCSTELLTRDRDVSRSDRRQHA